MDIIEKITEKAREIFMKSAKECGNKEYVDLFSIIANVMLDNGLRPDEDTVNDIYFTIKQQW
jgi:hypothetical protein